MEEYPKGTITEVELHDFMTYDHVIQRPGPKINFILGRNGSGKSSIVCAIALCCGSSPSFIGRASKLDDFIKHGRPSASIQLTLSNPGGEPVKLRRILRRGRSNECYYDGRVVLMEVYLEKIKEWNIMTDNLVQFLPQERVIDFSLMTPVQMLENTEKTVGEVNLYKIHQELIEKGNQWEDAGTEVERLRRSLDEAKDREAQLKHDVEALSVRDDISTVIRLASLKRGRLEIVEHQTSLLAAKSRLQKTNEEIRDLAEVVVPFEKKLVVGKAVTISATRSLLEAKKELENVKAKFDSPFFLAEPDNLQRENVTDIGALKGSKTRYEQNQAKIKSCQQAVQNLQAQQTDTDIAAVRAEVLAIQQQQMDVKKEIGAANDRKLNFLAHRRTLDEKMQKLTSDITRLERTEDEVSQYLRANDQNSFRARQWMQENSAKLTGKVYGPIYVEVKLKSQDKRHADILGQAIPNDVKMMFICEEDADVDLLLKEMVQGKDQIKVPIKKMNRQTGARPSMIDGDTCRRHLGCNGVVGDLFEAPDVVYRFLMNKCGLGGLPIFDKALDGPGFEQLKRNVMNGNRLVVRTVFAENTIFKFRTTRFSSNLANSSQHIPEARNFRDLMTISGEKPDVSPLVAELDTLKRKSAELQEVEKRMADKAVEDQGKFTQISTCIQVKRAVVADAEKVANRIRTTMDEIRKLEAMPYNYEEECAKTARKVKSNNMVSLQKLRAKGAGAAARVLTKTIAVTLDYVRSRTEVHSQSQQLKINLRKMESLWGQYRQEATTYDRDLVRLKGELGDHVKQLHSIPGSEKGQLAADALKQYLELPAIIQQLEAVYKSKKNQLNAAGEVNLNARKDLEKQIAATEKLEHSIATHKDSIAKEKERFAKQRKKWMDTIGQLVAKIGASFSHFYQKMNLAGDVVLQQPDNPDHFEKYGFAIKVSYRANRPLETLSGQVHSGGEKSVATALYMLAIQELTKCPFRVVDEINQGMDAENERRVFKMIVETAGRCGGQYFILSPKLLPDLHLTADVTVNVILAGPEMHSGSELDMWQLSSMARRYRRKAQTTVAAVPVAAANSGREKASPPPSSRKRVYLEEADEDSVNGSARTAESKFRPPHTKKLATVNRGEVF